MAPTLGQAKRLLWRPLMRDLRDPAAKDFVEGRPNSAELTVEFKTGTRLYLYSAEAYERVRGDGFKLFLTDETDDPLFTNEVFDEAIFPALSDNLGALVQLGTPKGRGRLFREYRKGQPGTEYSDPEYESIQVTAMDAGIIAPSEIERARRTRPRRAFEQEYLATFNAPVGLVYEEWSETHHLARVEDINRPFDEVIVGVDWGTAARGAMIPIGIDRITITVKGDEDDGEEKPRALILEEHSASGIPYTEAGWWAIARQIQRQWRPTRWYCDPAGGAKEANAVGTPGHLRQLEAVLRDECAKLGMPRAHVIQGDNRVSPGISAVQDFLHHDEVLGEPARLQVMPACPQLIAAFPSYRWSSHRGIEGEFVDQVVKTNDHELDAVRYALFTHFYGRHGGRRAEHGADWTS